jgi:ribosome maturation factor RimP
MSKITDVVSVLAKEHVEAEGCSLWDVEYIKEAGSWYLRIYIDKEDGVSIEDCERISHRLNKVLDEADPVPDSYIFEVASAGADRELKRPSDFEQFIGHEVEVRTYRQIDGQKLFVGVLKEYSDGNLVITSGDQDFFFSKQDAAQVRLHVSF